MSTRRESRSCWFSFVQQLSRTSYLFCSVGFEVIVMKSKFHDPKNVKEVHHMALSSVCSAGYTDEMLRINQLLRITLSIKLFWLPSMPKSFLLLYLLFLFLDFYSNLSYASLSSLPTSNRCCSSPLRRCSHLVPGHSGRVRF